MPLYRLRLDKDGVDDQITAFMKERASAYVVVHHLVNGENPHQHAQVDTKQAPNNFPKQVKEAFSVSGNGGYSNKRCDEDRKHEQIQQLFNRKKGNVPRLVTQAGFSPLDMATYMENAKQVAEEFEAKLNQKKLTKFDIAERIASQQTKNSHPKEVYDAVIELLHKNRMCSGIQVVKDIMSTIYMLNKSESMRDKVVQNFLD